MPGLHLNWVMTVCFFHVTYQKIRNLQNKIVQSGGGRHQNEREEYGRQRKLQPANCPK
jgi:hypothetical protein